MTNTPRRCILYILSYWYETGIDFYYLESRYYDPELCRFISPDNTKYLEPAILGGLNLYAYCNNNPVMYADPSGQSIITAMLIGCAIGALAGGIAGGISASNNGTDLLPSIVIGATLGAIIGAFVGVSFSSGNGALLTFSTQFVKGGTNTVIGKLGLIYWLIQCLEKNLVVQ